MIKRQINVPDYVRFISEWEDFDTSLLQGHSILNKTVTGCGFTTYALENSIPTILCSPRKSLLENKYEQLTKKGYHLFLVENNGKDFEIKESLKYYLSICSIHKLPPKILVTYDSLKHLIDALGIDIINYSIIVDEFQNIFMDATFKASVELNFVDILQSCPNVTYLSATPYIEEYLNELDEFKDLPYYELVWSPDKVSKVSVDCRKRIRIDKEVDKIIQDYLDGNYPEKVDNEGILHQSKEVVFFVNSVKEIISIIKRNNLTPDQVNIICADTDKNKRNLKKIRHSISKAPEKGKLHKMFTFCTRTTYVGVDFYSTCASTVVVSDCKIDSLMTDIRMDFPQIMGRQRLKENVFKDECIFIYKLSDSDITMEEFERRSAQKIANTESDIRNYERSKESPFPNDLVQCIYNIRSKIINEEYKNDYTGINEKTGEVVVNKLVYLAEKRAFELRSNTYSCEVMIYNEISNTPITPETTEKRAILDSLQLTIDGQGVFRDKMKAICDVLLNPDLNITIQDLYFLPLEYRNLLNKMEPNRIKANGYNKFRISQELDKINNLTIYSDSIKSTICSTFNVGEKYLLSDIKTKLQEIYNSLGITKTAKATDLLEYFEVEIYNIANKETGKRVKGYKIINTKI